MEIELHRQRRKDAPFVIVDRGLAQIRTLTWQAKGLMLYLLSLPDDWKISINHLSGFTDESRLPAKKKAVYAMLDELIEHRYIERDRIQGSDGRVVKWVYKVYDYPLPPEGDVAEGFVAQAPLQSNIELHKKIKDIPAPAKAGAKCTFAEFSKLCDDVGEKRIQSDDPVFEDMAAAGIPAEYLALHWRWFVRWAGELDGKGKERKYAGTRGWRQVFRKSVRECWSKLWWKDNKSGQWCLTQAGIMAQAAQNNGRE